MLDDRRKLGAADLLRERCSHFRWADKVFLFSVLFIWLFILTYLVMKVL
jgi:hypothetical protein